jgi:hypothetical protein
MRNYEQSPEPACSGGGIVHVIGKIVGHTNAIMTERYGHLVKGRDQEAVEKLPDWEKMKVNSSPLFPGPEKQR